MCWTCDRRPQFHDARGTRHAARITKIIFIPFCVCVCVNNNQHNRKNTWQCRTFSGKLNPGFYISCNSTQPMWWWQCPQKSTIYSNLMQNFIHNSNYFGSNFHHKTEFYDRHHPATDCYDSKRKKKKSMKQLIYNNKYIQSSILTYTNECVNVNLAVGLADFICRNTIGRSNAQIIQ